MFLSDAELRELTGRQRSDAMRRELEHLGIPFKQRRDGSQVVLVADLSAHEPSPVSVKPEPELNFEPTPPRRTRKELIAWAGREFGIPANAFEETPEAKIKRRRKEIQQWRKEHGPKR